MTRRVRALPGALLLVVGLSVVGLSVVGLSAGGLSAGAADRSRPPRPGPPRPLTLPPVERNALSNGLPVLRVSAHQVPSVEVLLVVRSGSGADPLDRPGLASMTADMLDEGAGGKDALALADAIDYMGAELTTASSWDTSTVRLHVPVTRLRQALPLMADVALHPDFPEKDLERLRKESLTSLLQARDDPRRLAAHALARAVFGEGHRYGLPAGGDAKSLTSLTTTALRSFHAKHYRPGNAALVVVGDVGASVLPLLEQAFGSWPRGGAAPAPVPEPPQVRGRRIVIVDRPGAAQSAIRIGRVGPSRATGDYHAIEVMNTLLGGSFTSRLNDNLREQHGYAYGASSGFGYRLSAGLFQAAADVQTGSTAEALTEFVKELERIRTPATEEEVRRARNYIALSYAEEFETTRQVAAQLAQQVAYGLPDDVFSTFVPKVLAVGVEETKRAAEARVDPANAVVVVVGDRKTIEAPVRALGLGPVTVLSVEDVMGPSPKVD